MSNRPSIYGSLCDRIGVDDQHRSKLFWAGIVGTPILFWALSSRSKVKQTPDSNINAFFKDKSAVRPPVYQPSKKKQATSFHSFLKEVPQAHRDATSFGAFLKAPASAKAVQSNSPQAEQASKGPKANEVVISVLFGTEYGFSKEVAERVAATVTACGSYWYARNPAFQGWSQFNIEHQQQSKLCIAGSNSSTWLIILKVLISAPSRL